MHFKGLRRSFRKQFKAQQKQVEFIGAATEKSIERNVFKRFSNLLPVRRFIFGWVALMLLLIGSLAAQFQQLGAYYLTDQPVGGGIYSEGMVGSISNVNPIYATSDTDRSLSRLVFAGLFGYDEGGALQPHLAEKFEASDNGRTYTVTLKDGLTWHDGRPVTASDVAFTFASIKNPDARSPLLPTWQNVTVTAINERTISFQLPGALASFPYSLTTGIIPKHILSKVSAGSLRSNQFNTVKPIGAGPFSWRGLQVNGSDADEVEEQVALAPFEDYVLGKPKLGEYIVRVFKTQERLAEVFASGQLTAAAGLNALPEDAPKSSQENNLLIKAGTYVFFKTTNPVLSSVKVRQALVAASSPSSIIDDLEYMTRPVVEPLLSGQLAYDRRFVQKTDDVATAQRLLAEDGWLTASDGTLSKAGQPLRFDLVYADTAEYRRVANQLQSQWRAVGVTVNVEPMPVADYSTALTSHDYDATLHGISIGEDPDVYGYWHSSQADVRSTSRLNLAEWKNAAADQALEAGRTRSDSQLRAIKYVPFLQAWQQESPALGLYQPRYLYVTRGPVYGLTKQTITSNIGRYNGVEQWQIRSARVVN